MTTPSILYIIPTLFFLLMSHSTHANGPITTSQNLTLFTSPTSPTSSASPISSTALSTQNSLLEKVQGFLNGIKTMKATFTQVIDSGNTRTGKLIWLRPYHIRFDYEGKPTLHLSSDPDSFTQKDEEGISTYDVWRTPASLLLKPSLNFKKDAHIKALYEMDGHIILELAQKDDPTGPSLSLIFRQNLLALVGWKMVDASGNVTEVFLDKIEVGIPLDKRQFVLK